MNWRTKLGFGVLAIAIIIIVLPVFTVLAVPPLDVHIEADEVIGPGSDPFIASGPAVDAGIMCPNGDVTDVSASVSGPPNGTFRILRVHKHFVCADGSGTFDIKMVVRLDLITSWTTARWNLIGGTGAYAGLHGTGSLIGIPDVPNTSIYDIYDGKLH